MAAPLPAEDFKALFRGHPGGIALITADASQGPVALTAPSVASVASVSSQPLLLLFTVSSLSSATGVLAQVATVVVHFLVAQDIEGAKLGTISGIDCLAHSQTWTWLASGGTLFKAIRAWVGCEVVKPGKAGEPTVYFERVLQAYTQRNIQPGQSGEARPATILRGIA